MRTILAITLILGALVFLGPATACADQIIFSNLSSTAPRYDANNEYEADIAASPAFAFTVAPGNGFDLTQLDLALTFVAFAPGGTNDGAKVELLNSAGNIPGTTVLGTWNTGALPAVFSTDSILQTISGISGIVLNGGTTYWLTALPADATAFNQWQFNNTGDLLTPGTSAETGNGGSTWFPTGGTDPVAAFDVLGTPVPEPSSMLLLVTGLLGLAAMTYRKKLLA